ncbi:MAG: hypothetical protein QW561_05065 [Candidatus Aenigmatarchaeota archaeon]
MGYKQILRELEEVAKNNSIEVRYDEFKGEVSTSHGGMCFLRGRGLIIINRNLDIREKIDILKEELSNMGLLKGYDGGK